MKKLGFYHVIGNKKEESVGVFYFDRSLDESKPPRHLLEDLIRKFKLPIERVLPLNTMQEVYDICTEENIGVCYCSDLVDDNTLSEDQLKRAIESANEDIPCDRDIQMSITKAVLADIGFPMDLLDVMFAVEEKAEKIENAAEEVKVKETGKYTVESMYKLAEQLKIGLIFCRDLETGESDLYTVCTFDEEHLNYMVGAFLVEQGFIKQIRLDRIGVSNAINTVRSTKGLDISCALLESDLFNIVLTPKEKLLKGVEECSESFNNFMEKFENYKK